MDLDTTLCKLNDCLNELDDISDELDELGINVKDLLQATDAIFKFYSNTSKLLDDNEEEPDFYHDKLQEKLDRENYGG